MSDLDKALEKYIQDENEQGPYYDLILSSDFYIPLNTEGVEGELDQQQSVTPLVLKSEDKHYMLLFDSQERLTAWAKKPTEFVILAGYRVAAIATPALHWAVNIGSGYSKEFVPEEIAWLKKSREQLAE